MSNSIIPWLIMVVGVGTLLAISVFISILAVVLHRVIKQIIESNKQLLIVVAGRDDKPETLRALVASNKPPQKPLKGIADGKKGEKPANTDYTMTIGLPQ